MSVSLEISPLSFSNLDPLVTEKTPPREWNVDTQELEKAYCEALAKQGFKPEDWAEDTIPGPAPQDVLETRIGPLCPDELVEDPIPSDAALVADAFGRTQMLLLVGAMAVAGLLIGVTSALLF